MQDTIVPSSIPKKPHNTYLRLTILSTEIHILLQIAWINHIEPLLMWAGVISALICLQYPQFNCKLNSNFKQPEE